MDCPYYQSYRYCIKIHKEMSEDLFDTYCMSSFSYSDCPIYRDEKIYSSSRGGCFLTSACVKSKGLPDNCYELTRLRWFRDNILAKTDEGKSNIELYYNIAPEIVNSIDKSSEANAEYDNIYSTWITPCVTLIDSGEYQGATDLYTEMVKTLSLKFLSKYV